MDHVTFSYRETEAVAVGKARVLSAAIREQPEFVEERPLNTENDLHHRVYVVGPDDKAPHVQRQADRILLISTRQGSFPAIQFCAMSTRAGKVLDRAFAATPYGTVSAGQSSPQAGAAAL